jgi:hypothetical protein
MATDPLTEAKMLRFEPSDVSSRGFLYFLLATGVLVVITCLITGGLFSHYKKTGVPIPMVAQPFRDFRPVAPPPRIQTAPANDMIEYRRAQEHLLSTFGWIDQQKGIARIPIGRAMELLLRQGLPTENQNGVAPIASADALPAQGHNNARHSERRSISAAK